jgi:hypothetical protein
MERLGQNQLHKVRRSGGGPLNKDIIQKGRSSDGDHGPQKEEKRAGLMEVCLISPQCSKRHKPSASDKFKGLSLQHWQSVIAAKELCVHCLRHSNLDAVTLKECTRRKTPPHWLGSEAAPGEGSAAGGGKGSRLMFACRTNIMVNT